MASSFEFKVKFKFRGCAPDDALLFVRQQRVSRKCLPLRGAFLSPSFVGVHGSRRMGLLPCFLSPKTGGPMYSAPHGRMRRSEIRT